jgi:hypothetical protein
MLEQVLKRAIPSQLSVFGKLTEIINSRPTPTPPDVAPLAPVSQTVEQADER